MKVNLLKMSNFSFFHNIFLCNLCLKILKASFHLSFVSSLNLGWSQNGVLGIGLKNTIYPSQNHFWDFPEVKDFKDTK